VLRVSDRQDGGGGRFPNLSPTFLDLMTMAQPGETRIQLCGRFVVRLDGRRVEEALPGDKGQLLFAYLVLNRLRRIDRDELLIAVYGEEATADHHPSLLLDGAKYCSNGGHGLRRQVARRGEHRTPPHPPVARTPHG
jgi:hypothetical protein